MAHHGGARHLAEGADMRQAGGAVAGLEQHLAIEAAALRALDQLARLLEGPALETRAASTHSAGNSLMTCFDRMAQIGEMRRRGP